MVTHLKNEMGSVKIKASGENFQKCAVIKVSIFKYRQILFETPEKHHRGKEYFFFNFFIFIQNTK
jgi:hypothetical protein